MPSRRSNGLWRGRIWIYGREITRSGFRTKREAAVWEKEERDRLTRKQESGPPGMVLIDFCGLYLDHATRYVNKVYKEKQTVCRRILESWGPEIPIETISPAMAAEYLDRQSKERSANASNKDRKNLHAMWKWGRRIHDLPSNPWARTDRRPHDRKPQYVPAADDIVRLLMAASREDRVFLNCYLQTGARMNEIFRLVWEDVNFDQRQIRLGTRKTTDGSMQYEWITMSEDLHKSLSWWWSVRSKTVPWVFPNPKTGEPFTDRRKWLRGICARAGIKSFGFHAMRRFVASVLADSGKVSLVAIQRLLRHNSPRTTERYIYNMRADQSETVKLLEMENLENRTENRTGKKKGVGSN